jgi:hypothetical protein
MPLEAGPESEPLVPRNGARRVLNIENRHDLLAHAAEITGLVGTKASPAPVMLSLEVEATA